MLEEADRPPRMTVILVVLRIIVFERSLFDFRGILQIGFVGVLAFVMTKTKRGLCFRKYEN